MTVTRKLDGSALDLELHARLLFATARSPYVVVRARELTVNDGPPRTNWGGVLVYRCVAAGSLFTAGHEALLFALNHLVPGVPTAHATAVLGDWSFLVRAGFIHVDEGTLGLGEAAKAFFVERALREDRK